MIRIFPRMPWSKKPQPVPEKPMLPQPVLWFGFVVILAVAIWLLVTGPANKPLPEVTPGISPAPSLQSYGM